jgi:hypothetical protein
MQKEKLREALTECELAYRFSPNSYTASAFSAVISALDETITIDWKLEYLDWIASC